MKSFTQFVSETEDAHKHGYQFHFVPNHPKGHHSIIATHPSASVKKDTALDHKLWLDGDTYHKTPKQFHDHVVGVASIRTGSKDPSYDHTAATLYVHPGHHRKGVASAMYDHYEKNTGHKIKPSDSLSKDAKKFWKTRKKLKEDEDDEGVRLKDG